MNGVKYLLDTNIIIGLLKDVSEVVAIIAESDISPNECAYSGITRVELLGFSEMDAGQEQGIVSILSAMNYLPFDRDVENAAIRLRRTTNLKLPDAIIAATAEIHGLNLLSLDRALCAAVVKARKSDKATP